MKIIIKDNNYPIFPQANNIYRVISYVAGFIPNENRFNFDFLTGNITTRQKQYYKSAAEYLGLIKNDAPTPLSLEIYSMQKDEMFIRIVEIILSNKIFYYYYKFKDSEYVVQDLMKIYHFSYSTAKRRLSTIKAWCFWCENIIEENNLVIM